MKIHLETSNCNCYPSPQCLYNPSICYPEYPWGEAELSSQTNEVYNMVRETLRAMGYDKERFGTPQWNPLGDIIRQGDVVLLKPNWVSHKNKAYGDDTNLTCLVTNPSVVRAVLDFVCIALKGSGKIILGDAPMQGTDIDKVFELSGYLPLFDFINKHSISVEVVDFRKYKTINKGGVMSEIILINNSFGSQLVELNQTSAHSENDNKSYTYKVSDYETRLTKKYHDKVHHCYEINGAVLLADVVINLPKPKTHRLGGITGAMKNFVGITYEKASLPHRADGSKLKGEGDSYLKPSYFKQLMDRFDDWQTHYSNKGNRFVSEVCMFAKKVFYVLGYFTSGDKFRVGSWYGNDTIWRTVVDLNQIVCYADKNGKMTSTPQRKVIHIGDMVVCGEKEGPIGPSPKNIGAIMMADEGLLFDLVQCKIMGFDENKIPSISNPLRVNNSIYSTLLSSNNELFDKRMIKELVFPTEYYFEPHSCWIGHIKKENK